CPPSRSRRVSSVAGPPATETRRKPVVSSFAANTIVSSGNHVAPRALPLKVPITSGSPPAAATLMSAFPSANPTQRPSDETNGTLSSCPAAISRGSKASSARTKTRVLLLPMYTIAAPSGVIVSARFVRPLFGSNAAAELVDGIESRDRRGGTAGGDHSHVATAVAL